MQSNFSVDWCSMHFPNWKVICRKFKPQKILEIGSFEGRSSEFWFDQSNTEEVSCIDTWEGSTEHTDLDVSNIETKFDQNHSWRENLIKLKGKSVDVLSALQPTHKEYYNLIYIDGSHDPRDVITDAVLSFQLLKPNGIMIFDDYLWINRMRFGPWHGDLPSSIMPHPKPAIDAFCNIYEASIKILSVNYQLTLQKL